jgi:hypothetical protein
VFKPTELVKSFLSLFLSETQCRGAHRPVLKLS